MNIQVRFWGDQHANLASKPGKQRLPLVPRGGLQQLPIGPHGGIHRFLRRSLALLSPLSFHPYWTRAGPGRGLGRHGLPLFQRRNCRRIPRSDFNISDFDPVSKNMALMWSGTVNKGRLGTGASLGSKQNEGLDRLSSPSFFSMSSFIYYFYY